MGNRQFFMKCKYCNQKIKEKERYTLVGTYTKGNEANPIEEIYYHLKCWKLYFNECVSKKFKVVEKKVMGSAGNMIKGIVKNMKGMIDDN